MASAAIPIQVSSGEPYRAIIEAAQNKGCDLNALLLGSVTTKVLTHSKISGARLSLKWRHCRG